LLQSPPRSHRRAISTPRLRCHPNAPLLEVESPFRRTNVGRNIHNRQRRGALCPVTVVVFERSQLDRCLIVVLSKTKITSTVITWLTSWSPLYISYPVLTRVVEMTRMSKEGLSWQYLHENPRSRYLEFLYISAKQNKIVQSYNVYIMPVLTYGADVWSLTVASLA